MQTQRQSANFDSIDHLATAIGFNLDFRQLESGSLSAQVTSTAMGSVVRNDFMLDRAFHQRGEMPEESLTFGFMRNKGRLRWAGKDIDPSYLLNFNSRSGFDLKSNHAFYATTFHVNRHLLSDTAETLGIDLSNLGNEEFAVPLAIDPGKLERLKSALQTADLAADLASKNAIPSAVLKRLEADIYCRLAACLGSELPGNRGSVSIRYRTLRRALSFIDDHLHESPRVAQICGASATSVRTLQRAFLEELGVSPKTYMQLAKLAAVRRDLERNNDRISIGEVARSWGFWHMGQFAQDYRRQFGERPSETRCNRSK